MPLNVARSADAHVVCREVADAVDRALASCGRAVVLVPSLAQALAAQRELAGAGGRSLGVTVTTPAAWASERWGVWGDGRRIVDAAARDVLCVRVLARAAARDGSAVRDNPGTAGLLADLARVGLPWFVAALGEPGERPEGVTRAEAAAVALLGDYAGELAARGLVEECEVVAGLADVLEAAGAPPCPVVLAGFSEMARAERELAAGLARAREVTLVVPRAASRPAAAAAESLADALAGLAALRGAEVVAREGSEVVAPASGAAPADAPARPPELDALLEALFAADAAPVRPTGAVRLLLPAGPSARPELVAREVARLVDEGAREVVVAAPDAASAWRELSGRLVARGVSARAQLSVPLGATEAGRAYLQLVHAVARLAELARDWPAPEVDPTSGNVRVSLADMSWWPPRDLSDFVLSDVSHVDAARARRLDADWRANRLLTPAAVLDQLQLPRDTSPEVAAATRELLRGRLGSAASKLLSPYVGASGDAPAAAPPSFAHEAAAVLACALDVARSLKELGLSADPEAAGHVSLSELVRAADVAFARARVALRPELAAPGSSCRALVTGVGAASQLAAGSADALVLLGQTSSESPVAAADDARAALLCAYGVEGRPRVMDEARARFSALARVPRRALALERPLFGADGKPLYPSVMLTELLACYGLGPDAAPDALARAFGEGAVRLRSETAVRENASDAGRAVPVSARELPAPAGRISAEKRPLVSPPPDGVAAPDARPLLSASQIETYLECPYKWFSLRRLRLRDADAGFTGAEMGTFAHRVLEVSRRELLARAVERQAGTRVLADLRAADPEAPWREDYRAEAEVLLARAQITPAACVPGSSVADAAVREEARAILDEEFSVHLARQHLLERGRRPLPQALVAHSAQQQGRVKGLHDDLLGLLDYESGMLAGFEPRFFEWGFGRHGAVVEYAGVRLTGTVDRIDVDAHGQAVVIDYKHKSDAGFAGEYDVFPKEGAPQGGLVLPRRVQSLVYGQVVRRAFPDLAVRAAVYLCTKGAHALAGAVDENLVDAVFGERPPTRQRVGCVTVPRSARFGREGEAGGMEALLDACEEAVAERLARMLAGDIEARPTDADACLFCPVLNCERRLRK